jgi:hypothetical protein
MSADQTSDLPKETDTPAERTGKPIELLAEKALATPAGPSQVTKCALDGVIFYVRENVSYGKQWLELCAPDFYWKLIAGIVTCEDSRERTVLKNELFTAEWAEQVLSDAQKA